MTGRLTLEWKVRLKLNDGSVFVGGYLNWKDGHMLVVDELSGDIHSFNGDFIEDFDVRKY